MKNRGGVRYILSSSYSCNGFTTFIPELIQGLDKVYILKGAPGSGRSTFIRMFGDFMAQKGYEVEFWVSAVESLSPDGVYIPQLNLAVVDGSLPQPIDPVYPGVKEEIINLGEYWDAVLIAEKEDEIIRLFKQLHKDSSSADKFLAEAAVIRKEIRDLTAEHLSREKLENLIRKLSDEILTHSGGESHYFASSMTGDGIINYMDELSSCCKNRYIFKGPSGSGISLLLDSLAAEAKQKGLFIEYYHCGLEPELLLMLIIPSLQLALLGADGIDITLRPSDVLIDLSDYRDDFDTDNIMTYNQKQRSMEDLVLKAQQELENAGNSIKQIKKIYASSMDFESLDSRRNEIIEKYL